MLDWTEYAKIFLALIVIVNPVGAVPLFASMTSENIEVEKRRIAVVPLAIPLLSGPGAISTIIIYATARPSVGHLAAIVACAALVAVVTWIALRAATSVSTWLAKTGVNIAMRLMGL